MEDLSGDGKVTRKDVLIGRGVLDKDGSPVNMGQPMSNVQNQTIQGFNTPMPGNFSPRVHRDAMQVYGTEYDRAMAMPNRGLSEEDIMNSTPLAMRKNCPYKK